MAFGINVKANDIYLWSKEFEGKNGKYKKYSVSLSNKNQDGTTEYMPFDVQLPRNCPDIANKTKVNFDGFLAFSSYKKGDTSIKNPKIVVMNITLADGTEPQVDGFQAAEDDIPF